LSVCTRIYETVIVQVVAEVAWSA